MKKKVALTFDFDAMSVWIGSFGASAGMVSRGEFGRIGVDRILALLARQGVEATFFVPGHTALAYPDSVKAILAAGHEVAHHGFVHEKIGGLTPEQERKVLERGFEALDKVGAPRPVGYRSPSWDFTPATPMLLTEAGFLYDSSLMATDFTLYWPRTGDEAPQDRPYVFGREVPLVEIPVAWLLDDFPHFELVRGGTGASNLKAPSEVYEIWLEEFRFFAEDPSSECFTLTMHPQVIGRGSRIAMLDRLIDSMKELSPDASFESQRRIAEEWKRAQDFVPTLDQESSNEQ